MILYRGNSDYFTKFHKKDNYVEEFKNIIEKYFMLLKSDKISDFFMGLWTGLFLHDEKKWEELLSFYWKKEEIRKYLPFISFFGRTFSKSQGNKP